MTDHPDKLPIHLAIIMDGNGRWAQARGLPREAGHRAGAETVRTIVTECRSLGIRHLTLYTFSSENWNCPKTEISALFSLLMEFLSREVPRMVEQGITMRVLGDLDSMPLAQRTALRHAIKRTEGGKDMVLNLALNYGFAGARLYVQYKTCCARVCGLKTSLSKHWPTICTPLASQTPTCLSAPAESSA